jgi:site-specific recombinase XerD
MPTDLAGRRDRALILVGFASALRRSELAALSLDENAAVRCELVHAGLRITIARSKGDQHGAGAEIAVPEGRNYLTCPAHNLRAWLTAAAIESGPIFRPVDRFGRLGDAAICDRTVARVVKDFARLAGLDARIYAAHSLRRGMITDAAAAGASPASIQAHARHARWDTTRGYIEDATRFSDSAAGKLGL